MSRRQSSRGRKIEYYSAKRRAVYRKGDEIDHLVLFNIHGWLCNICEQPINRRLRFPNYMAATVEHIIPLSQGGTHTWDNTAAAHAKCNFDKGDSLPPECSSIINL